MDIKILDIIVEKENPIETLKRYYPNSWLLVKMKNQEWYCADSRDGYDWKKIDKLKCQYFSRDYKMTCNTPEDLLKKFDMKNVSKKIIIQGAASVWMGDTIDLWVEFIKSSTWTE